MQGNCDILVEKSIVYICNFLNSGSSCKCDTFSPIVTDENTQYCIRQQKISIRSSSIIFSIIQTWVAILVNLGWNRSVNVSGGNLCVCNMTVIRLSQTLHSRFVALQLVVALKQWTPH